MKTQLQSLACLCGVLPLALTGVSAQEPAKAEQPAQAEAAYFHRLIQAFDAHGREQLAFVDLSQSLLSPNGLGIDVAAPDRALRAQLGLAETSGLVVTAVAESGAGAKAGLKVHDVILAVGEQEVGEAEKFRQSLESADGKAVKLRVLRQGKEMIVEATPTSPTIHRVAVHQLYQQLLGAAEQERYRIGVTLAEADETLRTQLRLATGEGLVVTEVIADSAAAGTGVQVHDVLILLDGKRLTTVEAVNNQVQEIQGKTVELRLLRAGKEMTISLAPRKVKETSASGDAFLVWETDDCRRCHVHPFNSGTSHAAAVRWLSGSHPDGTGGSLRALWSQWGGASHTPGAEVEQGPQQQIQTLKKHLGEMQQTIAALETALAQPGTDRPAEAKKD
jgi:C-terminal processing protease CtpA/Prc